MIHHFLISSLLLKLSLRLLLAMSSCPYLLGDKNILEEGYPITIFSGLPPPTYLHSPQQGLYFQALFQKEKWKLCRKPSPLSISPRKPVFGQFDNIFAAEYIVSHLN